jgi:hypothetical protein
MRRRDLLLGGAAGAGGLLLGGRAWAARSWGEAPAGHADLVLPRGERAERCLEVFLYGGLGPFESFYVVPEYGRPQDPDFPDQQWWLFANDHEQTFTGCGLPDRASWLEPFGADALGRTVQLGPVVQAFRDRPDLLARMRIVVMGHELEPHEAAIPYSLSGYRLGNPRMAGTAAHLQRYFQERDGARSTPYAYTFTPLTELSTDNLRAANAVGMHPGSTRPLGLKIGLSNTFSAQLERARVGDRRAAVDELRAHLLARAEDRYTDPAGAALRSRALADHAYAVGALADADALSQVLTPDLFTVADSSWCGSRPSFDLTTTSLHAAVSLLTHPTEPARYALVVDGGLIPAAGGGALDTHEGHLETHARNLGHTLRALAARINAPGESDPAKVSLDDTLVAITTDFGRTPFRQDGSRSGTNHHPYGYVQVLLGGPVRSGVSGAIGPDGVAAVHSTPGELRVGMLAAMGLWPFAGESFAVGDVRGVGSEAEAQELVMSTVLGVAP